MVADVDPGFTRHHATAPDIHEKINVERGESVTEAIQQATIELDEQKGQLPITIHNDSVSQVKRELDLIEADPNIPFLPKDEKQPCKFEQ